MSDQTDTPRPHVVRAWDHNRLAVAGVYRTKRSLRLLGDLGSDADLTMRRINVAGLQRAYLFAAQGPVVMRGKA